MKEECVKPVQQHQGKTMWAGMKIDITVEDEGFVCDGLGKGYKQIKNIQREMSSVYSSMSSHSEEEKDGACDQFPAVDATPEEPEEECRPLLF